MMQRRRRKAKWLTYDQASLIVKQAGCTSARSFRKWMAIARPNNIPLQPQRVYKEWTGWGDFVGVYNTFGKSEREHLRPYWEAVRWAQRFCQEKGLKKVADWWYYYDNQDGEIPEDIPRNAQYYYANEWQGWATWLGTNIEARIIVAKEEIGILALCNVPWAPANVIRIVVANDGVEDLRQRCINENMTVFKAYKFEKELMEEMQRVLGTCGGLQSDGTYIIRDMNTLIFEFSCLLLEVKLQ